MGLDITHYKLKSTKSESTRIFLKDNLDFNIIGEKLPNSIFSLENIDGIWEYIAIFKNEKEAILEKSDLEWTDGFYNIQLILNQEDESFFDKIFKFEEENKLSGLKQEFYSYGSGSEVKHNVIAYCGKLLKEVAYFEVVGHQRKKASKDFFTNFENDKYYTELKYFKKLFDFRFDENDTDQLKNLTKNFIENYEEGKSFLMIN